MQSIAWIGWEEYLQILESIKETLAGGEVAEAGWAVTGREGGVELLKEFCCPQGLVQAGLLKARPCSFQDFCRSFLDGEGCAGVSILSFHPWNIPACAGRWISAGYPIPVEVNLRNHTSVQTLGLLHFQ